MAPSYTIPALARSFEIIECIAEHPDGIAFSSIVEKTGAPKSSVFRILHTLEAASWIEKREDLYALGDMMIHYGLLTLSRRSIAEISGPILESLLEETEETAHLAVPAGKKTMILDVKESKRHITTASGAGNLHPLHCTSHGKLFLAYNIADDLEGFYYGEELEKRTARTITDLNDLQKELERIRAEGCSQDKQEYFENIWCGAAPVFDRRGECIGAIGITGTTITCTPDRIDSLCSRVKKAAAEVSRKLGNTGSSTFKTV